MPKFKVGDFIIFNRSAPRYDYYKIVGIRQTSYVVDVYNMLTDELRRANCTGSIIGIDTEFIPYHPVNLTQIRRP